MKMVKFNSIEQFAQVVKRVRTKHDFKEVKDVAVFSHDSPYPTLKFSGTPKIHGTNGGIAISKSGELTPQSRSRVLSLTSDNQGFAAFVYGATEVIKNGFRGLNDVVVFGEWCGQGIQKNVSINNFSKRFVVFAIKRLVDSTWVDLETLDVDLDVLNGSKIYLIQQFTDDRFKVDVDFEHPEVARNKLVELTNEVEKDCPVGRFFLNELHGLTVESNSCEIPVMFKTQVESTFGDERVKIEVKKDKIKFTSLTSDKTLTVGLNTTGEGVVWKQTENIEDTSMWFKVKGEKHAVSKNKVLSPVDVEKVKNVKEFVDAVCTDARLEQGIEYLKEMQLTVDRKNTGTYLKWVVSDVLKEEIDRLVESGLCVKDVTKAISDKSRVFWFAECEKTVTRG